MPPFPCLDCSYLLTSLTAKKFSHTLQQHISQLRNEVTSPGGSTAAALYQAEKGGIRSLVSDIVWAAYRRTLELAKSEGKDKV